MIQETARSFMRTWYPQLVEGLPNVTHGAIAPTAAPGHGVSLRPDVIDDARTISRITARE